MTTRRLGVAGALIEGRRVAGDVAVVDGRIAEVGLSPPGRGLAAPGLIDLQVNGYGGVDLLSAGEDDAWRRAGAALLRDGVTACQPTLITAAPRALIDGLTRTRRLAADPDMPLILGAHLEGPFLSPERLGTHPPAHRRDPDLRLLSNLLAAGPVSMMTLAPELPAALDVISALRDAGAVVSLGHSAAPAEDVRAAVTAGASAVTHIFNAMSGPTARAPGLVGVALSAPQLTVMGIADGVHVADELLSVLVRCALDRLVLVSDAIAAAGTHDSQARLGDQSITVVNGLAARPDGTLAGSAISLADGIRRLVHLGVPVPDAVRAATETPARLLRRADIGVLRPGADADVVIFADDDSPEIVGVLRRGRVVV